ncbi:NUDIX hydrolase [Nitratireductor sp. ZSWI3]|uniref:NUDIX hydrolase n=1 Tax=Nitratireductor sp. ZSWI3 TaxID=2966359 RepID=UPI00214F7585|nr:NUDIX hydrolase [Nitratireductor sp. ZSWI3]MCR4265125.1 NUDIX hydrolase [Nitratireductor sp. ZSWI3]
MTINVAGIGRKSDAAAETPPAGACSVPVSCRALLTDRRGRVLLVRPHAPEKSGRSPEWQLPGGAVAAGETLALALIRRLHEQLEVLVCPHCILHIVDHVDGTNTMRSLSIVFGASVVSGDPVRPGGRFAEGPRWFALADLPEPLAGHVADALASRSAMPLSACRRDA